MSRSDRPRVVSPWYYVATTAVYSDRSSFRMVVEQYDFTAQSRSTAALCMVLQVGKMVLLTAARGMHEFFQI